MKRILLVLGIALLTTGWRLGVTGTSSNQPTAFIGPCDIVSCAASYSVTRAMSQSYSGPLFQLSNGVSTLDIGQTAGHVVDLSTWSAFCSGVASNCKYGIIYDQSEQGNNLVPSTINNNSGVTCAGGGFYKCAALFAIEVTTGLPVLITGSLKEYYHAVNGADDTPTTTVHGARNPASIIYNGQFLSTASVCCGNFGITHYWNGPIGLGTDYMVLFTFGTTGFAGCTCVAANQICAGVEEESICDMGADLGTVNKNIILGISNDTFTNTLRAVQNGQAYFTRTPPAHTLSPGDSTGRYLHFGGGGDLSQPAPAYMREMLISNNVIVNADQVAVYKNMTAFYNTLSFPP